MYIPSDEMLDWMPVMLSEDEARELLGEEDLNGKLVQCSQVPLGAIREALFFSLFSPNTLYTPCIHSEIW